MIWIILGIILLILIILLFSPVKVYVKYFEDEPEVILKYLFLKFVLVGGKAKKKPEKSKDKTKAKKVSDEKKDEATKKKKTFLPESTSGKIDLIKNILKESGKLFKRLTKHIKFKDIYIDIQISDLDACECAVKFGKANIVVYNLLVFLGNFVKLKKKKIGIKCVYNQPESVYNISFNVRISLGAIICIAVAFIFKILIIFYKERQNKENGDPKHLNNKKASQENTEFQTT